MGYLTGRAALVVGPGTDADLAIVAALAGAGVQVVVCPVDGPALADRAGQDVGRLEAPPGDPTSAGAIIEQAKALVGRLDILVQNRPTTYRGPIDEMDWPTWTEDLARLTATVAVDRAFAAACEPEGAIVDLTSIDLAQAYPGRASASAVANGLVGASRAMAVEWARKPVRVNVVAQGIVFTEADRLALAEGSRSGDRVLLRAPSHRIGTAEETAALVRFLVDDRSLFITGQVISVDGGWASLTQHAEGLRFP
jgi:NAD(P)-dependent dehydrogenase (short-subunit alcohol dehydrogenase family)